MVATTPGTTTLLLLLLLVMAAACLEAGAGGRRGRVSFARPFSVALAGVCTTTPTTPSPTAVGSRGTKVGGRQSVDVGAITVTFL